MKSDLKKHKFQSMRDLFMSHDVIQERANAAKYVTKEFQDYGYRLAVKLNDMKHKSLYIKLAKNEKRPMLDQALSYTLDYPKARNRARIFMWKIKDLKAEHTEKNRSKATGDQQELF